MLALTFIICRDKGFDLSFLLLFMFEFFLEKKVGENSRFLLRAYVDCICVGGKDRLLSDFHLPVGETHIYIGYARTHSTAAVVRKKIVYFQVEFLTTTHKKSARRDRYLVPGF